MPLSRRDKLFCDEYIIDWDGSRAARAVGVPKEQCYRSSYNWLARPDIIAEIQRLTNEALAAQQVTTEMIMQQYAKVAFADRRRIVDDNGHIKGLHELDDQLGACVEGYKVGKDGDVEIKMASKIPALRALGEATNWFKQHEENKAPRFEIIIQGKDAEL